MRNKAALYARVLVEIGEETQEKDLPEIIWKFKVLLKKRGDFKHASAIIQEFKKMWAEREGKTARVVMARRLPERILGELRQYVQSKGFLYREEIDARLIGGIAIFWGKEYLIDGTIKTKLHSIAKKLWQKTSFLTS